MPSSGLATTLHAVPFQCSASVSSAPKAPSVTPTAQASFADVAITPLNWSKFPGLGVVATLQRVPFQCSATVTPAPLAFSKSPTAHALVAEVAGTDRSSPNDGEMAGLVTTVQKPPS